MLLVEVSPDKQGKTTLSNVQMRFNECDMFEHTEMLFYKLNVGVVLKNTTA